MWWHDCVCVFFLKKATTTFFRSLKLKTCYRSFKPRSNVLLSSSFFFFDPIFLSLSHTRTHKVYTTHTHTHTQCKQRVIDRFLHPASAVFVLISSAGPASPVHSVQDELLHGSSFFLPSPSPLWPSGSNGKTFLVNYLCVKAASATYHTVSQEC